MFPRTLTFLLEAKSR